MKEGDLELLSGIAQFEDSHDTEKEFKIGWSWRDVRVWPTTLNRLFKDGYLENVFKPTTGSTVLLLTVGRIKFVLGSEEGNISCSP